MKKFSIIFSAFVVAALTACTLYMDEPEEEEGRILRTGEGYDKEETITLPDGQGSVTYEYSQKTIPINDEVEQYIVKVESDSILYFESGTPEELLPEVGEMMTCSFRDRFPNAFCHKCIERTEQNGIYRCVFSKCEYGEAFKVLDVHFNNLQMAEPEGGRKLTQEEEDSLFEETEEGGNGANSRSMRRRVPLNKNVKKYTIPIEGELGVSAVPGMDLAGAKVGIGGEVIIGGWIQGDISFVDRSADFDVGIIGGLGLLFDVQARAGITYKLPVSLTPIGFRFDLVIIGGHLGFVVDPYLSVHREVYGHAELALGIDCGFHYKRDPKDKEHPWGELELSKSGTSKMAGKTPFFYVNDYKESKGFDLNIEAGIDYSIGVGFKIGEGAAQGDFSVGVRTYGVMQQQIDTGEFQSAEDFQKKNAYFPTYALGYISLEAGVFWAAVKPQILVGPEKLKGYYIPVFPVSKENGSVRCVDMKSKWLSADAELIERGMLSYWRSETPKLKIYDKETKKLVGTMDMHWVKERPKQALYECTKMTGSKKVPEIEVNHEYIAQFALDMSAIVDKALFPLEEVPFHVAKPIVELESVKLIYTQSARNASLEEMANPKLVASNGSQKAWIYQNKVYNYRYIMDIIVPVKGLTKIGRWGLLVTNDAGRERDVYVNDRSGKLSQKYKVRLHWYTSKQTENLCIQSYSVGLNENGKMTYDREIFDMEDYEFDYNPNMDFVWAQTQNWGSGVDFEFMSRKKDPSDITVHFDNIPDADGSVLGDVEVIPIDD